MANKLQNTDWLAERLGLSKSTIERMRTTKPEQLPPHILLGRSYRYDIMIVEAWIALLTKLQPLMYKDYDHNQK